MSINPINNSMRDLGAVSRPTLDRAGSAPQDRGTSPGVANQGIASRTPNRSVAGETGGSALKPQTPIAGQNAAGSSVPAEAPAGTDPSLWSVLTTEERNFFAKSAAMGPLTYGRIKAATNAPPPAARGVRLDVRA